MMIDFASSAESNSSPGPVASITVNGKTSRAKAPAKKKPSPSLTAQLKAAKAEVKTLKLALAAAEAQIQPRSLLQTLQALPPGSYDMTTEALIGRLRMRLAGASSADTGRTEANSERVVSYDPAPKQ